jgi:hypothetical protein
MPRFWVHWHPQPAGREVGNGTGAVGKERNGTAHGVLALEDRRFVVRVRRLRTGIFASPVSRSRCSYSGKCGFAVYSRLKGWFLDPVEDLQE